MDKYKLLCPTCVQAEYHPQRLPQFKGNPLIEALPPVLTEEQLYESLTLRPDFAPDQRSWTTEERLFMLESLSNFMVPMARHIELARSLDNMLRSGYVGRAPRTPEHAAKYQAIYSQQKRGEVSVERLLQSRSQISALLLGLSGMGKTTTVKHWFSRIPQVIYHPEYNLYQVTRLHVEMPSDGSSIKGLAHGILQEMDRLIPGANYYEDYALRGRPGADALMRGVARVLNMHCVGFLIADEIQNLANSHKGKQTVMTELVSACNDLGLPVLFIGTNKAEKVFSLDFRQSRRASGRGISEWGRLLPATSPDEVDEWRDFLEVLWSYQWVRRPVALDAQLSALMYHYSQGVIDVAIKLFASAQARAMLDGSEHVCPELLTDVFNKELKLLHPMVEALRANDLERLAQFEDIAPMGLDQVLATVTHRLRSKVSSAHQLRSKDASFPTSIAASLVASGFGEQEAVHAAEQVAAEGKVKNLAEGTVAAIGKLTAPKKAARPKTAGKAAIDETRQDFSDRPGDYRRAIAAAREAGSSVFEQLRKLGMARPLEEVLDLN